MYERTEYVRIVSIVLCVSHIMSEMGRVCVYGVCMSVCVSPSLWKNEQLVLIFVSAITQRAHYLTHVYGSVLCWSMNMNTNEKFLDVLIGVINNDDDSMTTT